MYSPTLGRFLQTGPIGYGDGLNWYNYVGGDPVNATDPSGLVCQDGAKGDTNEDCKDHGGLQLYLFITGPNQISGGGSSAPLFVSRIGPDTSNGPFGDGSGIGALRLVEVQETQMLQSDESKIDEFLGCAAAFGENFLSNIIDPISTGEGLLNAGASLAYGITETVRTARPPVGGVLIQGRRTIQLARVGVRGSILRAVGAASRSFAAAYAAGAAAAAAYQASQDKRCQ